MTSGAASPDAKSLLQEFNAIEDEAERQRQIDDLARHRPPTPELIAELCDQVHLLLRVDLRASGRAADTVRRLADLTGDPLAQARSRRTLANVLHRQGEYRHAMAEFDRALELLVEIDSEVEIAATHSTAIHNLIYLGEYDRAQEWADLARQTFERHGDRPRLARLKFNRANILFRQDRREEAAELYQEAYRDLQEVGEPQEVAVCLRTLAVCQIFLNDFSAALASYEKARGLCWEHDLTLLGLENDYNIAYLYFQRGEYKQALTLYKQAHIDAERIGDREHVALCNLDQAEIYLELNLVGEAEELSQAAFDQFRELEMPYEAAKAVTALAIAHSRQGKEFLAVDLLDQARSIFADEGNEVWTAQIDLYQAMVFYGEGRLVEALTLGQRALNAFTALSIPNKASLCNILLAKLALDAGEIEEARDRCRLALEELASLHFPALEYQALFVFGQIEEGAGNPSRAISAYRRAQKRLDLLRSHLQTDELKITFLKDKLVVFEKLVTLLLADAPSELDKLEAFRCIEKAKSRSLADLMAFRAHALPANSTARSNLVARIRDLHEELNWYYRRIDLHEMHTDEASRSRLAALHQESRQRESHLVRTLRESQATDLEYSSLQDATTIELADIRESLPERARILEFYIAGGVVYACIIGRELLETVPLTVSSRARELHRLLQFQLSKYLLGTDYVRDFQSLVHEATEKHLRSLYDELLAPIEEFLDSEHLVIVPHDYLHHVPFQALHDGRQHLIDRFSISYAPSASVYSLCRKKKLDAEDRALVMGVSDEQAPQIAGEARTVADALEGATLLLNEEATEENLRRLGQNCRILHIATHGVFRRDNPMFSALQLGDSRLSLFDLYSLRLNADLVVLSGCGTGLNVVMGADELVGLARGILYAGARAVLVTLWDVNDASTAKFMASFHRRRRASISTARALQEAMSEARSEHPHPYFWAPFVLVGDPG